MDGLAYRVAASCYRGMRRTRNRMLNRLDPPVVILLYHRVTSLDFDPQLLAVTGENFRSQLRHLKSRYPVLRLEDDWSGVREPSVALSFDDGYADNFREALPILLEENVPATFFITTGAVRSRTEFWSDELERVVFGNFQHAGSFRLADPQVSRAWSTATAGERLRLYGEIHPLMVRISPRRREDWLGQLRRWAGACGECRETHRPLSVDELLSLSRCSLVTIGAHTVSHACLSALPVSDQREEIVQSKRQLESWLDRTIELFAYPYGTREHYTRETVRLCREAGFTRAVSNFSGQVHRWSDPYQLPRHLVRNWRPDQFLAQLDKFWTV